MTTPLPGGWHVWPGCSRDTLARREVVRRTVENALAAGDRHVRFLDGATLFGTENRDDCSVDRCHPNTLGFRRMADAVIPALRELLGMARA